MPSQQPLVSVIVPCYKQARFLGDAIESVLAQTYPHYEIIVVDDGSTDDTMEIAARYRGVRCIRQENQGDGAARNTGLRESSGNYLVFLDADDRLLPEALETGLGCLDAHPDCVLVFGLCRYIGADGAFLSNQRPVLGEVNYPALLRGNLIEHPAAAMCRRGVLDSGARFDASVSGCSDYEFYLRVSRSRVIRCHNQVVSEYRQHEANASLDTATMLRHSLSVLHSQRPFVEGDRRYEKAYRAGLRSMRVHYGRLAVEQAIRKLLRFLKDIPRTLSRLIVRTCVDMFGTMRR